MFVYNENKFIYLWNGVVTLSTSFLAFYLPMKLDFLMEPIPLLHTFHWIAILVFIADFFVNLLRFRKGKEISFHGIQSWKAYMLTWFVVDLASAIPFSLMEGIGVLQLLALVKLFRAGQYMHQIRQTEVRHSSILTLAFFLFWITHLAHWFCCGWLALKGVNHEIDVAANYIASLYWVVTTLTTVGYGDIVPTTSAQMLYSMFVQIAGLGVFGYLISNMVGILSKSDQVKSQYLENIEQLKEALKRRRLPNKLQKRILDYYGYLRDEKMGYDESTFLSSLPESLRMEVAVNLKKDFIEKIPLFDHASDTFIGEVALKLELIVAIPGDYIFKAGDPGEEMYFITSGELSVISESEDEVIRTLSEGDFFGEIALFNKSPRTASVQASSYCNLYRLKSDTFKEIVSKHPDIARQIEEKAKSREAND